MHDDEGYEVVGTSRRHWLLRPAERMWEVWASAVITGAFFGGVLYLSNRELSSLIAGMLWVLAFGVVNAVRLKRAQRTR